METIKKTVLAYMTWTTCGCISAIVIITLVLLVLVVLATGLEPPA